MPTARRGSIFLSPLREYVLIPAVVVALVTNFIWPQAAFYPLLIISASAALPTFIGALEAIIRSRINIDAFNSFALLVSFGAREFRSAAFIVLMLASASLLEWYTKSQTNQAVEELLKLKPHKAWREANGEVREVPVGEIKAGDILLINAGARVPVDGVIVFGSAFFNESPVTGESAPVEKTVGDEVWSATINESNAVKIKATRVGKDSTIERMAVLIAQAAKNKSRSERLADRFAAIFLPIVLLAGVGTYLLTHNIIMTAALFLVACADDMAVAIPLAITAALGRAAKRGVIIKGGEWLNALQSVKKVVLDKTGTLTYGNFSVSEAAIKPWIGRQTFWESVAAAEKFSEHPIGRSIFKEAYKYKKNPPDPEEYHVIKGQGVVAKLRGKEIALGDEKILVPMKIKEPAKVAVELKDAQKKLGGSAIMVAIDRRLAGIISVSDVPRAEAKNSVEKIRAAGVDKVIMFTGDNKQTAARISLALGMDEFQAAMKPEDKLRELERMASPSSPIAMVGDGINDAPALARADVGIAMGGVGTAVAVEAADIVILTDNLDRLPEMMQLGRSTMRVVNEDIVLWVLSNAIGFALVFTGIAGPALAAFYNFATDFFPLFNSSKLFRWKPE